MLRLCFALLVAVPSVAHSQEPGWRYSDRAWNSAESPYGHIIQFVDVNSIKRKGSTVAFWSALVYEKHVDGVDNVLTHQFVDCDKKTSRDSVRIKYDNVKLVSSVIESEAYSVRETSLFGTVFTQVCRGETLPTSAQDFYLFGKQQTKNLRNCPVVGSYKMTGNSADRKNPYSGTVDIFGASTGCWISWRPPNESAGTGEYRNGVLTVHFHFLTGPGSGVAQYRRSDDSQLHGTWWIVGSENQKYTETLTPL